MGVSILFPILRGGLPEAEGSKAAPKDKQRGCGECAGTLACSQDRQAPSDTPVPTLAHPLPPLPRAAGVSWVSAPLKRVLTNAIVFKMQFK